MGWGNESSFKRSWSHAQDGRHAGSVMPCFPQAYIIFFNQLTLSAIEL